MLKGSEDSKVALITGTSSNLGVNIAYRLLEQIPSSTNLTLIVTSRTLPKVKEVITQINEYSKNKLNRTGQLEFDYLLVDFTDMVSVLSAYYDLNKKFTKIDYLFVNAAQGVYSGIDWIAATRDICKNPVEGVTNPKYKTQRVGVKSNDGMGLVFQANVFGPYYLIHKIKHLLQNGGRIVWISSLMSEPSYLSFNDLQLLRSPESYEGSKRLVDLMHFGTYGKLKNEYDIEQYLVQPGIFTSFSFFKFLNVFTYYGMLMLFYLARFFGSTSHNISGFTAANAPVKCAVGNESQAVKICSKCDRTGREFIDYQEIDTTGSDDVSAYLEKLCAEWDITLKNQIVNTRQP